MRKIDYNLPLNHPLNQEAAQALGLTWSEKDRMYINVDGTFPVGIEGNNDDRWGRMSKNDIVHAHK